MSSKCTQADTNIMLQIKAISADMQSYIKTHHVKSHQESNLKRSDNKTTMNQRLSWKARLNIQADAITTKAKTEITAQEIVQPIDKFPAYHWNLD
eukprot:4376552-Ditylum_brightwellii.AAC.1